MTMMQDFNQFAPAGEMLQERMADRQAGPLMPGGTFTGNFIEDPYKLFDVPFINKEIILDPVNAPMVGLPSGGGTYGGITPDYMSAQLNFPSIASPTDIQDITRRGGNLDFADFARTTTMGTGYLPPVNEPFEIQKVGTPIGSMGIQNQPMIAPVVDPVVAPVFDPSSFANTLLPPANEEMLYGNRQDWTGPLVNPLMSPWAGLSNPYNFFFQGGSENYNRTNPNWLGAQKSIWDQQYNDMINYGLPLAFGLSPMGSLNSYIANNLFDRFIR